MDDGSSSDVSRRVAGCLLGGALGDAQGAPFEGGWLERGLWGVIGRTRAGEMRFTDDTQMSIDLAESLLACDGFVADDVAARFAGSYVWHRGYGPGAAKLLRKIRAGMPWQRANVAVFRQGSWGNGGAMRAHVAVLFGLADDASGAAAVELARAQAGITHGHVRAQDGAALVAAAVIRALDGGGESIRGADGLDAVVALAGLREPSEWSSKLDHVQRWLDLPLHLQPGPRSVRAQLGNGISAVDSCLTAVYIAARFVREDFLLMLDFIRRLGGDVDTIGAMAGGIWGAARGDLALPSEAMARLEGAARLRTIAGGLSARLAGAGPVST
ncbi:ADP-ribosylglycohydrolase family protein [Diaphorobacter sp. NR2-3-3-1]|nr:ADP-ribosylglycohydrolase family protein [Diaphorobacter caeni]